MQESKRPIQQIASLSTAMKIMRRTRKLQVSLQPRKRASKFKNANDREMKKAGKQNERKQ